MLKARFSVDKLADFFSPPDFLTMPSAAFDLSDRSIKYLEVKFDKALGFLPTNYEERPLKAGIINAGDIQSIEELSQEIKYFRKKYKKFDFVNIALPEELAFVFDLKVKKSDLQDMDLRQHIEFRLPEFIPFSAQNATFDFDLIFETETSLHLSITVYPRDIVEEYSLAFENAGYIVKSAELETISIARAVIPNQKQDTKTISMVLDVGTNKIGVSILAGLAPLFSTAISFPMRQAFEELFEKKFGKRPKDDEELFEWKFKDGILFMEKDDLKKFEDNVLTEIIKIKNYFNSHKSKEFKDISHLYVSGGNAATKGFDAFLESALGIDTSFSNVWQNMFDLEKYLPEIDKRRSFKLATVNGLILKDRRYE